MTYRFTYSQIAPGDETVHLTSISGPAGESWQMTYAALNLASPISSSAFGGVQTLASLKQVPVYNDPNPPPAATFNYDAGAEMTGYTTPLGGSLTWVYSSNAYASNITLREVSSRSVNAGAGGFTNSHTLTHPSACDPSGGSYHGCTQILDNGAGSKKIYFAAAQNSLVLPSQYQETDNNGTTLLLQKNFTWSQNRRGRSL